MLKSGLIIGLISLVLVLGSSLIHPLCAPCLAVVLGLLAGYLAGVFEKPLNSSESVRKGGFAGAIAGGFGLLGGLIGGVVNSLVVNPVDIENFYRLLGNPNRTIDQGQIWLTQMVFAVCVGLFNVVWMAALGIAGAELWYRIRGKKESRTLIPPTQPTPPTI